MKVGGDPERDINYTKRSNTYTYERNKKGRYRAVQVALKRAESMTLRGAGKRAIDHQCSTSSNLNFRMNAHIKRHSTRTNGILYNPHVDDDDDDEAKADEALTLELHVSKCI